MADQFTMFEKFGDVCEDLNEEDRKLFIYALSMYGMFGEVIDLPFPLNAFFKCCKDDIDNSRKSRKEGGRHGKQREANRKPLSDKKRFMILERDGFRCQYCGATAEQSRLEVDHIVPVSKGGTNDPDNLVTACHECNSGKRAHIIGEPRKRSK